MATETRSFFREQPEQHRHQQCTKEVGPFPKFVFFIAATEFCERFCYFGLQTVLTIYISSALLFSENDAKVLYHMFVMLCYFMPLFGAIVADSWLGKFKTIFYLSIVYIAGSVVLSIGAADFSLHTQTVLSLMGLALIAIGTGGIKPCVATFGADQFVDGQEAYLERYFLIFYMCVNLGSTLGTAITPLLRGIHCYGQDTCFSLAFGVPSVLMLSALACFLMGSSFYTKHRPGHDVIGGLTGCISRAAVNRFFKSHQSKDHWLDHADDKYGKGFIEEVKSLCRVLVLFLPAPVYWALFNQLGSTWILQAARMRLNVVGYTLFPEQIHLLGAVLMVTLTPIFGYVIYPTLRWCNLLTKPLQKMILGGIFAAVAFFACAIVQVAVEDQPSNAITLISIAPCPLTVTYELDGTQRSFNLTDSERSLRINRPYPNKIDVEPLCRSLNKITYIFDSSYVAAQEKVIVGNDSLLDVVDIPRLGKDVRSNVNIFIEGGNSLDQLLMVDKEGRHFEPTVVHDKRLVGLTLLRLEVDVLDGEEYTLIGANITCGRLKLSVGELYAYVISAGGKSCWAGLMQAAPSISVLWQVPQYFLIVTGEILFGVTGLEFVYTQAPKSLKSVVMSCWMMTLTIGNLLVVIIAKIGFAKQSTEFAIFGVCMLIDLILFTMLAYFYKPLKSVDSELAGNEPIF